MMLLALLAALLVPMQSSPPGGEPFVVIDPGHGGQKNSGTQQTFTLSSSNNAISPGGLREKDLTLELSLEIKKQIDQLAGTRSRKLRCVLTRKDDSNPDFAERAATCAAEGGAPAAIVSIHFNASNSHDALGSLAVIRQERKNSRFAADRAFTVGLIAATSGAVSRFVPGSRARDPITDAHLHDGLGSNFFFQLARHSELDRVPKCFLEVEFIDRTDVDTSLLQKRQIAFPEIARAIATYLYDYCGIR